MGKIFSVLFITFLASVIYPQTTGANEVVLTEPLKINIGDSFTYQGFDSLRDATSGSDPKWTRVNVVSEVSENGFTLVGERGGSPSTFNKDGNLISSQRRQQKTISYSPFWPTYRYPLRIGDSYKIKFTHTWQNADGDAEYDVTMTVVGWEKISVPAGTFQALRVEMEGQFKHPPFYDVTAFIKRVEWLAHETRMRPILTSHENSWGTRSQSFFTSMKSFSLK